MRRVYPDPDPDFYYEPEDCASKYTKLPKKSWKKKPFQWPAFIQHWGDFSLKAITEVTDKEMCMFKRPPHRRRQGAVLTIVGRGPRVIPIVYAPPICFNCTKQPGSLKDALNEAGMGGGDEEPQFEVVDLNIPEEEEEVVEEPKEKPEKPKKKEGECLPHCFYDDIDPTWNDPKKRFRLVFEPNVSMIAHLNRNKERKAKAAMAQSCSYCMKDAGSYPPMSPCGF